MATDAQILSREMAHAYLSGTILANRRNAQKSTRPRTREGKAAVSQNAVKHGLLARQAVISSEIKADFDPNYAKQSQFPKRQNEYNLLSHKGL